MKTLYTLIAVTFVSVIPLHAQDSNVQAAVVAKETNAELREVNSTRANGRRTLEVGEVYQVGAPSGRFLELKIDSTRVALLPPDALRVRSCTPAELSAAQAKFNVLNAENQREARKVIADNKRDAKAKAAGAAAQAQRDSCATCPIVRDSAAQGQADARAASSAARTQYSDQKKALRNKNAALAKEALAWADAGQSAPK